SIRGVLGDTDTTSERQVAEIEVARTPTKLCGVSSEHDRARTDRLRTGDEAANELKILGPVELEPARSVAHRASDLLHGVRSLAREDVRDAQRGRGLADGDVRAVPHEHRRAD